MSQGIGREPGLRHRKNLPSADVRDAETLRTLAEQDETPPHAVKGSIDADEFRTRRGYPD